MTRLILIDTNLLIVAIVAEADPTQVERVGRTRAYTLDDVRLLRQVTDEHENILVTPHILTEASNLLGQIAEPLHSEIRSRIAALVPQWAERADSSAAVVADPYFMRFGMTDAAVARCAGTDVTILTDDLKLYAALAKNGNRVINFTHVRTQSWRETLAWR